MFKFLSTLAVLSSLSLSVYSQWEGINGPEGAQITSMVSDQSTVFVGTLNGVFKLDQNGTWVSISQTLPHKDISAIARTPYPGGYALFAATFEGIYRTLDGGNTWSLVSNMIGCRDLCSATTEDFKPVIYATTVSYVYKSLDFGDKWSNLNSPRMNSITSLRVVDKILFAVTISGAGLYKFGSQGWSPAASSISEEGGAESFTSIGSTIFLVKNSKLYSSVNYGSSWSYKTSKSGYLSSIGSTLFFSTNSGLYASLTNGNSWSLYDVGTASTLIFKPIVAFGSNLYAGSKSGIYKSSNIAGTSWTRFNEGLSYSDITALRSIGDNLWAGTFAGLFVSNDGGANWSHVNDVQSLFITCIYAPDDTSLYVGTTDRGVFYSYDAGESWTCINPDIVSIRSITKVNDDLYVLNYPGLYKMSGDGAWSQVSTVNEFSSIVSKNGMLYASKLGNGVFFSQDGISWTPTSLAPEIGQPKIYNIKDTLFVSSIHGFYSSGDGITWTRCDWTDDFGFVYDMTEQNNILYAASGKGVYRSVDNATTWNSLGLTNYKPSKIAMQGNAIYGGKYGMVKKDLTPELSFTDLTLFKGLKDLPSEVQKITIRHNFLPSDISVSVVSGSGSGFEFQSKRLDYSSPFITADIIKLGYFTYDNLYLRLNRNELGSVADSIAIRCSGMPTVYIPVNGIVLEKFSQTIDFPEIGDMNTTDHSFEITATASSELPVIFETTNTDIISISDKTASILGPGEVTITAHQFGNEIFFPAEDVSRTFTVDLVLGIGQHNGSDIYVYPNPTSGKIQLADNVEVVTLTNIHGQSQSIEWILGSADLKSLPAGLYLLTIKRGSQLFTTRIVKN